MKKSKFKQFLELMSRIGSHLSKSKHFHKLRDNPAGTKMAKRAEHTSRRGCDGTMRL